MTEDITGLLRHGHDTIVRSWAEKVTADRRVRTDAQLTYLQLLDHVPDIVEELREALASGERPDGQLLEEARNHGRTRWQQGYELKEVVRELTLLRAAVVEFIDAYRGALATPPPDLVRSYNRIAGFMDEEIYRTIEAYLEAHREAIATGGISVN
ncbi:MAG TPA: RsbRD N-terminal domain-containing protein [Pyrinomonadaceae bacterium]